MGVALRYQCAEEEGGGLEGVQASGYLGDFGFFVITSYTGGS